MNTNLEYINQICTDLGGTGGHVTNVAGENEICTLLGGTGGHSLEIDALNEICTLQSVTGSHGLNLEALKSIGAGSFKTNLEAWSYIQSSAVLNQNEPEVTAYIYGLTTPLSSGQIAKLNKLVKDLKTAAHVSVLSDAFDTFYDLAGETAESSLKNLVKNAHHATAVNSPTFTAFEGFEGNGSSSYIDLKYNPNTQRVNLTLNSGSFSIYSRKSRAFGTKIHGIVHSGQGYIYINPLVTASAYRSYFNGSSAMDIPASTSIGMFNTFRTSSTGMAANINKNSLYVNNSMSSLSIPNGNLFLLAANLVGTGASFFDYVQLSAAYTGRNFSQSESDAIVTAIEAYMDSNGKGIIA